MSGSTFAVRRAHLALAPFLALALHAGCSAPRHEELAESDLEAALALRAGGPAEAQLDALDLAGLRELALPRPTPEECADPRSAAFWRACAWAWNPQVRETRLHLQRAFAAHGAAGRPEPVELSAETDDLSDLEVESTLAATFDLLGLFGLGPAGVARESARIDVRRAHRHFEAAVWAATFEVERARVRLAATRVRLARLNEFLARMQTRGQRFEILERRGRLSEADAEMVRGIEHEVEHAISHQLSEEAEARAELARASGLPYAHAAFDAVGGQVLDEPRAVAGPRRVLELWMQDPALRELAFEFALAEVNVRLVASRAWPTLRVGPQLTFEPDDVLLGGLIDVSLPWPGTIERELRVAYAERDSARARIEDALHFAVAREASLRTHLGEARMRATEHGAAIDGAAEAAWQSVDLRLRFGQAAPEDWTRISRERLDPLLSFVNEREEYALAALDLSQACGVVPAGTEVSP